MIDDSHVGSDNREVYSHLSENVFATGQTGPIEINLPNKTLSAGQVIVPEPGPDTKELIFSVGCPLDPKSYGTEQFNHLFTTDGFQVFPNWNTLESYIFRFLLGKKQSKNTIEQHLLRSASRCYSSTLYTGKKILLPNEALKYIDNLKKVILVGRLIFLQILPAEVE